MRVCVCVCVCVCVYSQVQSPSTLRWIPNVSFLPVGHWGTQLNTHREQGLSVRIRYSHALKETGRKTPGRAYERVKKFYLAENANVLSVETFIAQICMLQKMLFNGNIYIDHHGMFCLKESAIWSYNNLQQHYIIENAFSTVYEECTCLYSAFRSCFAHLEIMTMIWYAFKMSQNNNIRNSACHFGQKHVNVN